MPLSEVPPSAKFGNPNEHHPSQNLMISCGTIPIDPSTKRIALLRDPKHNRAFPPKGRKNINESLLDAALRESHEETGLTVSPLPLYVPTRATKSVVAHDDHEEELNLDVTEDVLNTEPISVCAFTCSHTGAFKLVFWFAGRVDETEERRLDTMEAWESHWELEWVDAREASGKMTYASDAEAVEKLLQDMRRSGYDI